MGVPPRKNVHRVKDNAVDIYVTSPGPLSMGDDAPDSVTVFFSQAPVQGTAGGGATVEPLLPETLAVGPKDVELSGAGLADLKRTPCKADCFSFWQPGRAG